jgi:tripartite-type tricarboxylate transporter receptor subunit TctC
MFTVDYSKRWPADLISVHYRGGGLGLVDLLAGQVQVMFEGITSSMEYVRAGKLRAGGHILYSLGLAAGHPDCG